MSPVPLNPISPTCSAVEPPAVSSPRSARPSSPEYGEYLASDCKTCHKVKGSSPGVPLISGVDRKDLTIALHAYKQKIRKNPVMQMMANRLSNEDIAALAIYFEGLK